MSQRKSKTFPDALLEQSLLDQGYEAVIGIDEVGRGCWAGPVYLGAYVYSRDEILLEGVADSKLLSPQKRVGLYAKFIENTAKEKYSIEIGTIEQINSTGIGNTIKKLIENVLEKFNKLNAYFLIDGQFSQDFGKNTRQIIKGDVLHYSISAASILAKVERDALMQNLAKKYPNWGFDAHKGYGTKAHIEAISKYGISEIHRTNYKPIAKVLEQQGKGRDQ